MQENTTRIKEMKSKKQNLGLEARRKGNARRQKAKRERKSQARRNRKENINRENSSKVHDLNAKKNG